VTFSIPLLELQTEQHEIFEQKLFPFISLMSGDKIGESKLPQLVQITVVLLSEQELRRS
jgi:hypothetical protein